jgi:hypothetical protein
MVYGWVRVSVNTIHYHHEGRDTVSLIEHYHVMVCDKIGKDIKEVTIVKDEDGWSVYDDWGDLTGQQESKLFTFKTLQSAAEFSVKELLTTFKGYQLIQGSLPKRIKVKKK